MAAIRGKAVAVWVLLGAMSAGDSIVIDGTRHDDVIVVEEKSMYYVKFPETGEVLPVLKNRVAPETVALSTDAGHMRRLKQQYQKSRAARPAPVPKPAPDPGASGPRAATSQDKRSVKKVFVGGSLWVTNLAPKDMRASNPRRIFEDRAGVVILTNLPERYEESDAYIERTLSLEPVSLPARFLHRPAAPRPRVPAGIPEYDPEQIKTIKDAVSYFAAHYGLEEALVLAVIRQESNFNPNAVSPTGARGLMQLMPGTAGDMGIKGADIFDSAKNIAGGCQYLSRMLRLFGSEDLALAAYNAGPGNVKKYGNKIPPFKETQHYVPAVQRFKRQYAASGTAEIKIAKAPKVAPDFIPGEHKGRFEVIFTDGLTQLADKVMRMEDDYLMKYGDRLRSVPVDRVRDIRKVE